MTQKFAIVLLAALLAACNSQTEHAGQPATETTETTATTSETSATTTASTGGSVSNMRPEEKEFIAQAGLTGLSEVQMGNLALQKATNPDVKAFAQRMVADHTRSNEELQLLATQKGLALATELDGDHRGALDHLNGMSGAEFDRMYMQHMVEDHTKTVANFQNASQTAGDADVKAWAAKTLPTLQDHLRTAQEITGRIR